MKNYIKLINFLGVHRRLFFMAVGAMIVASIFEGFQLPLIVPLFDRIFNDKDIIIPNELPDFADNLIHKVNQIEPSTLYWVFPILVIVVMGMKQLSIFTYQYLMNSLTQNVMRDIRDKLYDKIQNLSLDYFGSKRTGELISRITFDVSVIESAISSALIDLFRQTFMIIIYVSWLFIIYPKAAALVFLIFPLIGFPMSKIGRRLRKISKDKQAKMADINSILLETISGIKVVKAFGAEKYETQRFKKQNREFYKLMMKAIKRLILISPITEIFGALVAITVILWLGRLVMLGVLSEGIFILFMASIMTMLSPVKKLGNVHATIQQAVAAGDRIYEVLDAPITVKEKADAGEMSEMKESITLKDVEFSYKEDSEVILKGINLEIAKGELVAIVGPTGTGKTTLANLISRFYDPTKGSITMDGVDLREVSLASLRKQFGVVTQESVLFNDTVRANIAYACENPDQAQVEKVARQAFADQFIQKMPQGYDTLVGDRGFRLSGGEKQRLCIARAIYRNPPILVLDEATSQLDSESEKYVQDALDNLMRGRTVVAIAHRLSTVKKANKIVVLDQGHIVGLGKHDELIKSCELYKRLHDMQFQA